MRIIMTGLLALAGCGGGAECDVDDQVQGWVDADGDGFGGGASIQVCAHDLDVVANGDDCDDDDPLISPFGDEVCNGTDDDCDGRVDERFAEVGYYADTDGDGYGDPEVLVYACAAPEGHVRNLLDCDDTDAARSPDATEVCNDGIDDDCDGLVDDDDPSVDPAGLSSWYADVDDDLYGDAADVIEACDAPPDRVENADDCDDTRDMRNPDAVEVCNGIDDDCDGDVDIDDFDLDVATAFTFFLDDDGDGLGDPAVSVVDCTPPAMHVSNDQDCDDGDPAVLQARNWLLDSDMDGVGGGAATSACDAPSPDHAPAIAGVDCDDTNPLVFPGQVEVCNGGTDDDCDGLADDADPDLDRDTALVLFVDGDGDGYGDPDSPVRACTPGPSASVDDLDCDDADPNVNPDGVEVCNRGVDDDCSGTADDDDPGVDPTTFEIWFLDGDDDGVGDLFNAIATCDPPDGYVADPTDCDDNTADIKAPELWFDDGDGDGFGAGVGQGPTCTPPGPTWVPNAGAEDCDDLEPTTFPGAPEVCDDGVDQDCNGVDFCLFADDFESPMLDPLLWFSLTGDGSLSMQEAASGMRSANLSGGGGVLTSVPIDTLVCSSVLWSYQGQRGPEEPEPGEFLYLEWFDGAAWQIGDAWEGNDFDDPGFSLRKGEISDVGIAHATFQVRWRSEGNSLGNDDYFIDDVTIDCL